MELGEARHTGVAVQRSQKDRPRITANELVEMSTMQRGGDAVPWRGRHKRQDPVVELCPWTRSLLVYFPLEFWCMYPLSWSQVLTMQWRCPESSLPFMSSRHSTVAISSSEFLSCTPKLLVICSSVGQSKALPTLPFVPYALCPFHKQSIGQPCQLLEKNMPRLLTLGLVSKCWPGNRGSELNPQCPLEHLGAMVCTNNPNAGEVQTDGFLELI